MSRISRRRDTSVITKSKSPLVVSPVHPSNELNGVRDVRLDNRTFNPTRHARIIGGVEVYDPLSFDTVNAHIKPRKHHRVIGGVEIYDPLSWDVRKPDKRSKNRRFRSLPVRHNNVRDYNNFDHWLQHPRETWVCLRRQVRKQVLFAFKRAGKGGGRRNKPRYNEDSKIRCKRR